MTGAGVYRLVCHTCARNVQVPATDGLHWCPLCNAELYIQWSAARAELDQRSEPRK
jgi:hypothetical protein